jgi:hypothetical protein
MHCLRVSEAERDAILNDGVGPGFTIQQLDPWSRQELQVPCGLLREKLQEYWTCGCQGEDCFVHDGGGCFVMLCVEISSKNILDAMFLERAAAAVRSLPERYCVDCCKAWGILMESESKVFPDFNIFITSNQIAVYTEGNQLEATLGISWE